MSNRIWRLSAIADPARAWRAIAVVERKPRAEQRRPQPRRDFGAMRIGDEQIRACSRASHSRSSRSPMTTLLDRQLGEHDRARADATAATTSRAHGGEKARMAASRSASAAMATRAPPSWNWQSTMASMQLGALALEAGPGPDGPRSRSRLG